MLHRLYAFTFACLAAIVVAAPLVADTPVRRFDGQPKYADGKALGYFVWRDGDTWKLRWMTFGAEHRFTGNIRIEGGTIRSFKRVDADVERKVLAPGRAPRVTRGGRVRGGRGAVVATREEDRIEQETEHLIRFSTRTDDDVDGIDFRVTDAATHIRLMLEIDGQARPAEVEVGRDNYKPNESPLVVTLK